MANLAVVGIDQTTGYRKRLAVGDAAVKTDGTSIVGSEKGAANGVASLDGASKVPSAQITAVLASSDLTNDAALEKTANKGAASGYASLNGSSTVVQNPASATTTPTASSIPLTGGSSTLADGWHAMTLPRWVKVTKTFTDLSFAGLTNDIEVYSLAAGGVIHNVKVKHSASFTGGTIATYDVSIGITGNFTKYSALFDVFQAPGNTVQQFSTNAGTEDHGAATSIRIQATSSGDDLDQATTGSVDVWLLVSTAL